MGPRERQTSAGTTSFAAQHAAPDDDTNVSAPRSPLPRQTPCVGRPSPRRLACLPIAGAGVVDIG